MLSPAPGTIPLPALGTSPATPTLLAGAHMAQGAGAAAAAAAKPNKGIILAKSVEYIRSAFSLLALSLLLAHECRPSHSYLQQLVELHAQRNSELERLIHELRINPSAGGGQSYPQPGGGGPGSTTSFETSSGMNSGTGTSDARSPAEGHGHMSASMASSHFGDPNFNENCELCLRLFLLGMSGELIRPRLLSRSHERRREWRVHRWRQLGDSDDSQGGGYG